MLIQNVMKCMDQYSPDYMFDALVDMTASFLQLSLRLYLKFIKKISSSNELLSFKFILILIFVDISYFLPLPENSQSYVPPFVVICAILLTTIIFDHSGFNQYFMENHQNFRAATAAIWHLMNQFYIRVKDFLHTTWNDLQVIFLNLCRANQIQPYDVPE